MAILKNVRDRVGAQLSAQPTFDPSKGAPGRGESGNINAFNGYMRQQPWYQAWFQQHGLNPNQVHLSDSQRHELQGVLAQHGFDLSHSDGMNIDPAGNLNNPHGFASQPSWLKAVEIGAPIALGGYFAAPALFGGGAGAAGAGAGGTASVLGPTSVTGASLGGGGVALGGTGTTLAAAGGGSFLSKAGKFFGSDAGKLLTAGGLGMLEGATAPKPYETHSVSTSTANPTLTGEQDARLKGVFGDALTRAKTPVDLSNVTAQSPMQGYATDPGPALRKPGGPQAMGGSLDDMLAQLRAAGVPI